MTPDSLKCITENLPTLCPVNISDTGSMFGGAYQKKGSVIEAANLIRNYGTIISPSLASTHLPEFHLSGTYIFGGYIFDQFGHFLLESCNRLWYALKRPHLPLVWLFGSRLTPYQSQTMEILGITNNHVFINRPTSVDTLLIPDPAYRIQLHCSPEMISLMNRWPCKPKRNKKVWISRSALSDTLAKIHGEKEIEQKLAKKGWKIFHPELHSMRQQLNTYAQSEHISGFAGSAFHALILLKNFQGKISLFTRDSSINPNYITIAKACELKQRVYHVTAITEEDRGYRTSYTLSDINQVLHVLDPA